MTKRWRPSQRMARKPPPLAVMAASVMTKMAIRFSGLADIALLPEVALRAIKAAGQAADHDVPVAADQPSRGERRCDRNGPRGEVALAAKHDGRHDDEDSDADEVEAETPRG